MNELIENMVAAFPLMRGGGIFILLVGLGITAGAIGGRRWLIPCLIAGGVLAILSQVILARWLLDGLNRPAIWQWAVLGVAVVVEVGLVNLVVYRNPDRDSRQFWLWMLLVVGVHFLILGFSHGPMSALLGALCILNAGAGLVLLPNVEYRWFWLIDGLLKIAFGAVIVWMTLRVPQLA